MQASRQIRVASDLKKRLTEILASYSHDLPLSTASRVTITEVKVSGDLRAASIKIALGFSPKDQPGPGPKEVLTEIQTHTPHIQKRLAPLITFKSVPTLKFHLDDGGPMAKLQEFFNSLPDTLGLIGDTKAGD